jgi:hypothetical protein
MTQIIITYTVAAVIMWIHAGDLTELAIGVGGAWTLITAILWLVPQQSAN